MTGQSGDDAPHPSSPENPSGTDDSNGTDGSTVVAASRSVGRRVASAVRASRIYRWLTAEPDPEVIVIDLRETRTVGPFLRVLDGIITTLSDAASGSRVVAVGRAGYGSALAAPLRASGLVVVLLGLLVGLSSGLGEPTTIGVGIGLGLVLAGLVAMRDDRDWPTLRATRPVEIAIAAFEPPAPPDRTDRSESPESPQPSEPRDRTGSDENAERDTETSRETGGET